MGIVHKILSFSQRTLKADIVKVFSFTAMSTVVKMLTGLISVKVVASIIGLSGGAFVGQLNNLATIAVSPNTWLNIKRIKRESRTAYRLRCRSRLSVHYLLVLF